MYELEVACHCHIQYDSRLNIFDLWLDKTLILILNNVKLIILILIIGQLEIIWTFITITAIL